jgi:hypothetical protein
MPVCIFAQTGTEEKAEDLYDNIYTYFVVTPDEYKTLYVGPGMNKMVDGKNYMPFYSEYFAFPLVEDVMLRQDGMKFFCYDPNTKEEHLMFDFGIKKGNIFTDEFNGIDYKVTDIRDTIVSKKELRLIELRSMGDVYKHNIWMEGVGSVYSGIMPYTYNYKEAYLLFCNLYNFYPNNQYIKTADMNVTPLTWEGKFETEEDWREYALWESTPSELFAEFIGDTLHVWGKLNTTCDVRPYAGCEMVGNQITFKIYSWGEYDCYGIYEVETRIPGFQRGNYSIELLNKTIELENTEGIYTSINSVPITPVNKENIFDLSGRKVNSQLRKKGVYIVNGKKLLY